MMDPFTMYIVYLYRLVRFVFFVPLIYFEGACGRAYVLWIDLQRLWVRLRLRRLHRRLEKLGYECVDGTDQ